MKRVRPDSAMRLSKASRRKLGVISVSPQLFLGRIGAYRLAATERFPYAIYFIWDEGGGLVTVRRILHFKRDRRSRLG
jgi:hypothetical protein